MWIFYPFSQYSWKEGGSSMQMLGSCFSLCYCFQRYNGVYSFQDKVFLKSICSLLFKSDIPTKMCFVRYLIFHHDMYLNDEVNVTFKLVF